jgi:hypothetical protein
MGFKTDIWSLGIVFYEIMTAGVLPYTLLKNKEVKFEVRHIHMHSFTLFATILTFFHVLAHFYAILDCTCVCVCGCRWRAGTGCRAPRGVPRSCT